MHLKYNYWYFLNALSPKICDDIIATGKQSRLKNALTGNAKRITPAVQKKRKSNVAWLDNQWIYNEIHPYIHTANRNAGWNFQWDFSESMQFTKYNKGQFYHWHCDSWDKVYDNPNTKKHGKQRKLSVTVSLSDPKDYKGGELELKSVNTNTGKMTTMLCKEILPRGSIVVFPSHIWHRVKPVTKGIRYSLVMWNLGWPFK
tara:strand:+ start:262 stop:864 length:603 start_codon:yes stop_codon:yes gene_type:complete